jgi:hypothetical protein
MTCLQVLHENNPASFILACLVLCTEAIRAREYLILAGGRCDVIGAMFT